MIKQVRQWFATKGITPENPEGTAGYQKVMAKYKAQNRYGHPNHFVRHLNWRNSNSITKSDIIEIVIEKYMAVPLLPKLYNVFSHETL